jgi:hypothetical protein
MRRLAEGALELRAEVDRDSPAALAMSSTVSGSKYRASARSLARSRCLAGGTEATAPIIARVLLSE